MSTTMDKTQAEPQPAAEQTAAPERKIRLATVWLDGCSGCHMSLLDMDERILEIAEKAEVVYGPLVDAKEFPHDVDVAIVEGAVSSDEDEHKIRQIRERARLLVVLGDCGVTSNVPSMRNPIAPDRMLHAIYGDVKHDERVPQLLPQSRPIHEFVEVDTFIPGCPPSADLIYFFITELLAGRTPVPEGGTKFG